MGVVLVSSKRGRQAMSEEVKIHHLGPDDSAMLEGADVFDHPVDRVQLAAFLTSPSHEIVIALVGASIIGVATGVIHLRPDKPPEFYIDEVGVDEKWRGQKIGVLLMERLLEIARSRGCKSAWLATEEDNRAALGLYRKLGARETKGAVIFDWTDE